VAEELFHNVFIDVARPPSAVHLIDSAAEGGCATGYGTVSKLHRTRHNAFAGLRAHKMLGFESDKGCLLLVN